MQEWSNATKRRVLEDSRDFASQHNEEGFIRDDQQLQANTRLKYVKGSVPAVRLLNVDCSNTDEASMDHFSHSVGLVRNSSNNNESHVLFLARECECFVQENYERVYCPFATNRCGQVVNNHKEKEDGRHPETIHCYSESFKKGDANMHRNLWLLLIVVWALFLGMIVMTSKGRSCLSFLPSRLLASCSFQWNEHVADYLLRYRPQQCGAMIRNHIMVRTAQEYRRYRRAWQREQQQGERNSQTETNAYQPQEQFNLDLVLTARGDVVNATPSAVEQPSPRRVPTSLVLKTRIYHPTEANGLNDNVSLVQDLCEYDLDDNSMQCAICCCNFVPESDRVGALPCDHIFHVEPCLKGWLRRGNNSCPFCRRENVAMERFSDCGNDNTKEKGGSVGIALGNDITEVASERTASLDDSGNRARED
ncbi:ring finger domain containing protein [Nitzschia inconspicua]|uniref:Ring finger domain containing protein n=1 Tax=Nitzschia inconspicua TaxID=303405 RepID=A0A9K3LC54_9STRA|nr:ring finger domain containing protein [Nitzschia inconspicua]